MVSYFVTASKYHRYIWMFVVHPSSSSLKLLPQAPPSHALIIVTKHQLLLYLYSCVLIAPPNTTYQVLCIGKPLLKQLLLCSSEFYKVSPPPPFFFQVDPNIFPTDKIYPLPDENNLIRRGGNGQILAVNYEGTP